MEKQRIKNTQQEEEEEEEEQDKCIILLLEMQTIWAGAKRIMHTSRVREERDSTHETFDSEPNV